MYSRMATLIEKLIDTNTIAKTNQSLAKTGGSM